MRTLCFFAFLAVAAASSVSAVEVVGATRIRVTATSAPSLDVAEVVARDFNSYNVASAALGATAFAPTVRDAASIADNAIDGASGGVAYVSSGTAGDYLDIVVYRRFTLSRLQIFAPVDADLTYAVQIFGLGNAVLYSGTIRGSHGAVGGYDPIAPGTAFDVPLRGLPGYGGYTDGGDRAGDRPTGLGDERTVGALVVGVPEPASWSLLIGGFAMTGAALRRRRAGVVRA